MKNELLEQLKEIIEPKIKEALLEVVTDEELYDKIFEEIIYFANSLETDEDTISITIEESDFNEKICDVLLVLDKENEAKKYISSYITANGIAINTIDHMNEMFINNNDTNYFKKYDFDHRCIKFILDYPSIASGLKVRDVCEKIYEKQKEVSE